MTTQDFTAVGVFETRGQAELAVDELIRRGFPQERIGFAMRRGDEPAGTHPTGVADDVEIAAETAHDASEGAVGGALAGAGIGGLIGAASALLLPGVGPILAAGILASAVGGATIGAAAGGVLGALVEMGIPEEEARDYERELHAGRALVTVNEPGRSLEALEVFRDHRAIDAGHRNPNMSEMITQAPRGAMQGVHSWELEAPYYREHWQGEHARLGGSWEDVEYGYRYGHELGQDGRFTGRDWSEIEPHARAEYPAWLGRYGFSYDDEIWQRHERYVRSAWERSQRGDRRRVA